MYVFMNLTLSILVLGGFICILSRSFKIPLTLHVFSATFTFEKSLDQLQIICSYAEFSHEY